MIRELEESFVGTGEVSDVLFTQVKSGEHGYIYSRKSEDGEISYEVFERKVTPLCIDFENRIYSETDFKVVYPKAKDFGVWAWAYMTLSSTQNKFEQLSNGH